MRRSATLTTVPSSIAIPEPSTAASSTQRPCGAVGPELAGPGHRSDAAQRSDCTISRV